MYHAMMIEQKFYPVQGGPACLHRDDGNTLCLFGLGRHRPSGSRSSPASAAGESPIASPIRPRRGSLHHPRHEYVCTRETVPRRQGAPMPALCHTGTGVSQCSCLHPTANRGR